LEHSVHASGQRELELVPEDRHGDVPPDVGRGVEQRVDKEPGNVAAEFVHHSFRQADVNDLRGLEQGTEVDAMRAADDVECLEVGHAADVDPRLVGGRANFRAELGTSSGFRDDRPHLAQEPGEIVHLRAPREGQLRRDVGGAAEPARSVPGQAMGEAQRLAESRRLLRRGQPLACPLLEPVEGGRAVAHLVGEPPHRQAGGERGGQQLQGVGFVVQDDQAAVGGEAQELDELREGGCLTGPGPSEEVAVPPDGVYWEEQRGAVALEPAEDHVPSLHPVRGARQRERLPEPSVVDVTQFGLLSCR